jgi:hypothetical protein
MATNLPWLAEPGGGEPTDRLIITRCRSGPVGLVHRSATEREPSADTTNPVTGRGAALPGGTCCGAERGVAG